MVVFSSMENHFIDSSQSKMPAFHKIKDVDTLKSFGTYMEVKLWVEEKSGLSFRGRGWNKLFLEISQISYSVSKNWGKSSPRLSGDESLKKIGTFSEAKERVSELLSFANSI